MSNKPVIPTKSRGTWDFRAVLLEKIKEKGGWVNSHAHLDRAFTITPKTLPLASAHLHEKWTIVDEIKRSSTVAQIYDRMAYALETQLAQGVSALGSFIDVDAVIKDKSIKAAVKLREKFGSEIELVFMNQTLKGVVEPKARKWFDLGAEFVEVIGGLPGKDAGHEEEHLDIVLSTAHRLGKRAHIHVDQLNTAEEKETALLVKKTLEHNMKGRVSAIHGISIAAHPKKYRQRLYKAMNLAGVSLICCPTAWIDSRRTEELSPTHNSIAPVEELLDAGVQVSLGTDNIADVYKPFNDGDMWTELRFLLETLHFYDLQRLVETATSAGRQVLGLKA